MSKPSAKAIRDQFLAWQCRLRRIAVREHGGRPSRGMQPRVLHRSGREIAPALTILLLPRKPEESTAFFRHQVLRTQDPREAYERGLAFLQADHFQEPKAFSDRLMAVLPSGSELAASLLAHGACILEFDEAGRRCSLPSALRELEPGDAAREAAIWHNRLFNPALPDQLHVLLFQPDWALAKSDARLADRRTSSV
jgi:hypothetical protein